MGEKQHELWHRLDNESARSYEAFKVYLYVPPADRTIIKAFQEWTMNPDKKTAPPYFRDWASDYAWPERARAHDAYIERIREEGMEKAIREEAELQSRQVEQRRNRYNELMTLAYDRAIEWLEDSEWAKSNLRSGDVVKIVALHLESEVKLGQMQAQTAENDWEEEEDEGSSQIVAEVDAEAAARRLAEDDPEPEEDLL